MLEKFELPTTELKYTYRVEELEKTFNRKKIFLVALDVDNTVVDTSPYFRESMHILNLAIARELYPNDDPEIVAKEISDAIFLAYENNDKKPELINERYKRAIPLYTDKPLSPKLATEIDEYFIDFYKQSPVVFDKTPQFINSVLAARIPIVFHSHAQEEWTEIKVKKILEETGLNELDFEIPFYCTPLEEEKNLVSWLRAYNKAQEYYGIKELMAENVLNVGDNQKADILAASRAGCKNFIWINPYDEELGINLPGWEDNINLIETKSIATAIDDFLDSER
jgi:phosphoglycolate phosphatase-like HAD superfamily hydrolase